MSTTISVINNKGGVAKTTSVFTLGAYFASMGKKVLLLDFDAQASLTEKAMLNDHAQGDTENEYNIIDFLSGTGKIAKFYIDTSGMLFTMRGSHAINEFLTVNKNSEPDKYKEKRVLFRDKVDILKQNFDIILVDCAPGMFDEELLTPNEVALLGTDYVLIPIMPDNHSITGIIKVSEAIKRIKPANPAIKLLGVFFTNIKTEERLYVGYRDTLEKSLGEMLLNTPIRRSAELQQALSGNLTIFDYRPNSIASKDYSLLGDEILAKIPQLITNEK